MWRHATSFFFAVIPAIINSSISQYPVVSYLFFLFSSPLSVGAVACAIFPLLFCLSPHLSFLFTTPVSHPSWLSSDTISLTATSHSSTSIVILPIFWLPFRLSFAFSVHLFYCLFRPIPLKPSLDVTFAYPSSYDLFSCCSSALLASTYSASASTSPTVLSVVFVRQ